MAADTNKQTEVQNAIRTGAILMQNDQNNLPECPVVEVVVEQFGYSVRKENGKRIGSGKPVQVVVHPSFADGYEDLAKMPAQIKHESKQPFNLTDRSTPGKWKNSGSMNSTVRSTKADTQRKVSTGTLRMEQDNFNKTHRNMARTGDQKRWEQWLTEDANRLKLKLPIESDKALPLDTGAMSTKFRAAGSGKWGVQEVWELPTYETKRLKNREDAKYLDSWRESAHNKAHHTGATHKVAMSLTDRAFKNTHEDQRAKEAYGVVKNSSGKTYAFFAEEMQPNTSPIVWRP